MVRLELLTVTVVVPLALPDDAVTVIAVPGAAEPAETVAVALPLASVVAGLPESVPAEDEKVTVAPDTALLLASVACAVMVDDAEPSEGIVALLAVTPMLAAVLPPVPVGGATNAASPLPPHAANPSASTVKAVIDANILMYHPTFKDRSANPAAQ
jgi:hypothetical protein